MQLIYAINKNTEMLVHIDLVPNGNQCHCKCPGCGEDLVAKNNGKIKDHHFAHDKDHVCHHGYQTQLHLLSKEIFSEVGTLLLPHFDLEIHDLLKVTDTTRKIISIKEVTLEKKIDTIIPDIRIVDQNNEEYLIEIKVSHAVDQAKKEKIKNLNISCIEINLSGFELSSKEQLKETLMRIDSHWKWIYVKDEEKKIINFKAFTETIPLVESSNKIQYTTHCPLRKIKDTNMSSAEYIKDCQQCPFKLATGSFEGEIQCGGKLKIKSIDDIAKIDSIKKEKGQIIEASLKDKTTISFPLLNELKFGSIVELWEGKQMLIKKMNSDLAFVIKKDPIEQNRKYGEVYGDIYSNKLKVKENTPIFFFYKNDWYKILS